MVAPDLWKPPPEVQRELAATSDDERPAARKGYQEGGERQVLRE